MVVHVGLRIAAEPVLDRRIATQVLGSTCSMLVRGTAPVVKAWPSIMTGASDSTGSTPRAFKLAAIDHAVIGQSRRICRRDCASIRWQKLSSPPV